MPDTGNTRKDAIYKTIAKKGFFRATLSGLYPNDAKKLRKEIPGLIVRKGKKEENGSAAYSVRAVYGTEAFKKLIDILDEYTVSEGEHQTSGGGWMEP